LREPASIATVKNAETSNHHERVVSKHINTVAAAANQMAKHHVHVINVTKLPAYLVCTAWRGFCRIVSIAISRLNLATAAMLSTSHTSMTPGVGWCVLNNNGI
jgi:F0F1-type ATP synthase gamma subunit